MIIILQNKSYSEFVDKNGYFVLAIYIHYYLPGSLKIYSARRTISLRQQIEDLSDISNTRRVYLPAEEAPYPGYCRAPGSNICIPTLCNCQHLLQKWNDNLDKLKRKLDEKKNQGKEKKKQYLEHFHKKNKLGNWKVRNY